MYSRALFKIIEKSAGRWWKLMAKCDTSRKDSLKENYKKRKCKSPDKTTVMPR